jgi:hypothetical protein
MQIRAITRQWLRNGGLHCMGGQFKPSTGRTLQFKNALISGEHQQQ